MAVLPSDINVKINLKYLLSLLKRNKVAVLSILFLLIIVDIYTIPTSSDVRLFGVIGAYLLSARLYKLRSRLVFTLCLILLGIMFIQFLFTGPAVKTEKAAVWLVLFWILGIFQQWKETKA